MNLMTDNGYSAKIEYDAELAIVAQAEGKSINTLAQEALLQRVAA